MKESFQRLMKISVTIDRVPVCNNLILQGIFGNFISPNCKTVFHTGLD